MNLDQNARLIFHGKNGFAEESKNLSRCRF